MEPDNRANLILVQDKTKVKQFSKREEAEEAIVDYFKVKPFSQDILKIEECP
jgi:hypothetical protein